MDEICDIPIVFILCKGRSGSTLLRKILDAHPRVCAPPESRFVIYLYNKYAHQKKWTKFTIMQFYKDLFSEDLIRLSWHINRNHLKQQLLSEPEDSNFKKMCKIVYLHYQDNFKFNTIHTIVDKNPVHALFIPWLLRTFPSARFIHLVRDPRDVCLSEINTFNVDSYAHAALKWVRYNKNIEAIKTDNKDRFITIRYEDFVRHPSGKVRDLCNFLRLDYFDGMLSVSNRIPKNKQEKTLFEFRALKKIHGNVVKPITTNSIAKWKEGFTDKKVNKIEGICYNQMLKYEYLPEYKKKQSSNIFYKSVHLLKLGKIKFYYDTPIWLRKLYRKLAIKPYGLPKIKDE